jgi:subtilisin family serine protease
VLKVPPRHRGIKAKSGTMAYRGAGAVVAAPHAAGVAALVVGKYGGAIKPAQVEAAVRRGADDLGKPGNDDDYGLGRVNAYGSVE